MMGLNSDGEDENDKDDQERENTFSFAHVVYQHCTACVGLPRNVAADCLTV